MEDGTNTITNTTQEKVLVFTNPGVIDPRLITTMGVNVKDEGNLSPIGKFGTGLKYAIAIILRLGGSITIYSGEAVYSFGVNKEEIRGKNFNLVRMTTEKVEGKNGIDWLGSYQIGFTTELGKEWEPWMAYRELRANAEDEGGKVSIHTETDGILPNSTNLTIIHVRCNEILLAHENAEQYWLDSDPLYSDRLFNITIHPGKSKYKYHLGIAAEKYGSDVPWAYSYSYNGMVELTEDRTLPPEAFTDSKIASVIARCNDVDIIRTCLHSPKERELNFDRWDIERTQEFDQVVVEMKVAGEDLPCALKEVFRKLDLWQSTAQKERVCAPDNWEEMEANAEDSDDGHFPEVPDLYSYQEEMEERLKAAITRERYWKECARKLAGKVKKLEGELKGKDNETE